MSDIVIKGLKIGRHTYDITSSDLFMDNGRCIQLTTQSQEINPWSGVAHPVLSIKARATISAFDKNEIDHDYDDRVSIFSIAVKE